MYTLREFMSAILKNYNTYNIFNMTLHAGLANPTSLQSFMVWYCSVCEEEEEGEEEDEKFWDLWENRHFLFNH